MTHEQEVVFWLGLAVLLLAARALGDLARRLGAPAVVGEIAAGVLVGPTVLGRISPELVRWIFPSEGSARVSLDAVKALGVTLFMLVAGLEIELGLLKRVGRAALATGASSLVLPFALGFSVAWLAPEAVGATGTRLPDLRSGGTAPLAFALFFGTSLAISALPVIARILLDLDLLRTDFGLLVLSSAMLDDLLGWIVFSFVLTLARPEAAAHIPLAVSFLGTIAFAVFVLTIGRKLLGRALASVEARSSGPASVLAPLVSLGFLGGALTASLGTHAVIGAFLTGVALREHLREHVRETAQRFVTNVFARIYFATIGLRVDFAASFSPKLVVVVLALAFAGKLVGAFLGARAGGLPARKALAAAAGLNARGAMAIVLAELALRHEIVDVKLFTALVTMAVITSLVSAPLISFLLREAPGEQDLAALVSDRVLLDLDAATARAAIEALSKTFGETVGASASEIAALASSREDLVPSGAGSGVALPQASVASVSHPIAALAVARAGIDFDASDGVLARIVVLVVSPREDARSLSLVQKLAKALERADVRERILAARSAADVRAALTA